jgi:hypothetical protein
MDDDLIQRARVSVYHRDEALHKVLLDALASRYAPTTDDLCRFMSFTLRGLEAWEGAGEARAEVEASVAWLEQQGFFTRRRETVVEPVQDGLIEGGGGGGGVEREVEVLEPTPLAHASSRSGKRLPLHRLICTGAHSAPQWQAFPHSWR